MGCVAELCVCVRSSSHHPSIQNVSRQRRKLLLDRSTIQPASTMTVKIGDISLISTRHNTTNTHHSLPYLTRPHPTQTRKNFERMNLPRFDPSSSRTSRCEPDGPHPPAAGDQSPRLQSLLFFNRPLRCRSVPPARGNSPLFSICHSFFLGSIEAGLVPVSKYPSIPDMFRPVVCAASMCLPRLPCVLPRSWSMTYERHCTE